MRNLFSKLVRSYFTDYESDYRFVAAKKPRLNKVKKTNLYLHIPFCRSLCPYCPYNKIKYDSTLVKPYVEAVLKEIELYRQLSGDIEIGSVYIGGGTPTLFVDELPEIIDKARGCFDITGDVCIETNPHDLTDDIIEKLKSIGIDLISLGVQSFNDNLLKLIGRPYQANILPAVIEKAVSAGFKSVNIDLMFSIGAETPDELRYDLEKAVSLGVNQITAYPLFTFPYTSVGNYRKLKQIKMPNIIRRFRQYDLIKKYLTDNEYKRVSVWSYEKSNAPRFSSVTRDGYIGLGAGAGSDTCHAFYLNTFSVSEYIKTCLCGKFPTALEMKFNEKMKAYFWLYWRLYDTVIPKEQLSERFTGRENRLHDFLKLLKWTSMTVEDNDSIHLTDRGAFWVHLLQNYFALENINKVWSVAKIQPWPEEIKL